MGLTSLVAKAFEHAALKISRRTVVAGLPVWHFIPLDTGPAEHARVSDAITLIATTDPRRFRRIRKDLRGVWIIEMASAGSYNPRLNVCQIDPNHAIKSDVTVVAATIVHEATHARLWHWGFRYAERDRPRIERACIRSEKAFAERLPDSSEVVARAEGNLARVHEAWTDGALHAQTVRLLQTLDLPHWFIRWAARRRKPAA